MTIVHKHLNIQTGEPTAERLIAPRQGKYMHTFSGRKYWPLDPALKEVRIEDIASALSKKARYGGHTRNAATLEDCFYSVAEHSVYCAEFNIPGCNSPHHRLARLLHDASEAFNGDLIRPLKYDEAFRAPFTKVEELNERVVSDRFGLPFPFEKHVKIADEAVTSAETQQVIYKHPDEEWESGKLHDDTVIADIKIACLEWREAKAMFLAKFQELMLAQFTDDYVGVFEKAPRYHYAYPGMQVPVPPVNYR